MRTSRTPDCRLIDFSAPLKFDGVAALRKHIVKYVAGTRTPRAHAVGEREIVLWFRSTPPEFVRSLLTDMVGNELVIVGRSLGSHRRHNGAYAYRVKEDL